jgi:hypothetical protein
MQNLPAKLRESADAVARFGLDFSPLSDERLLDAQRILAQHRRTTDVFSAALAGEIARRSSRELGYAGLAQRSGFLSPEALIQSVTGGGRAEAAKHVAVGTVLDSAVGAAVLDSTISVDAAQAIQRGFGATDESAVTLVREAGTLDADRLYRRARDLRDELDASAIVRREKEQRDLRYFRYSRRPDGMVRGSFLVDALDGGLVTAAFDAVLSPRRGGPRFVSEEQKARDALLESDERTTEQIAADSFVGMIRLAVDADPGTMFGSRRPAVRVVVSERALASRTGAGRLEDHDESISIETVERLVCDVGIIGLSFDDDGQCMNVGRTQRLFTERQRIALAVRDGGCAVAGCDRPPSWCEAHHIVQWKRDEGRTDVADGILLCRRHHLMVHNNGWEIIRKGAEYWLIPPKSVDATQTPIPMPSKRRALPEPPPPPSPGERSREKQFV